VDPIDISGMAEARALKFCTKGDYIKSSSASHDVIRKTGSI